MKKLSKLSFVVMVSSTLLLTACSSSSEMSEPSPGLSPVPPVETSSSATPTLQTEPIDPNSQVVFDNPTFWSKTNCDAEIKNCKDIALTLSPQNVTGDGKQLHEQLYGSYKEATLYSKLQTAEKTGYDNCGSTVFGATVPEWNNKTVFFCEYDDVNDDQMRTLTMKVLEEAGIN